MEERRKSLKYKLIAVYLLLSSHKLVALLSFEASCAGLLLMGRNILMRDTK
jgi:hypothetical protein